MIYQRLWRVAFSNARAASRERGWVPGRPVYPIGYGNPDADRAAVIAAKLVAGYRPGFIT